MSLDLIDLDLEATVREVVDGLSSTMLYVVDKNTDDNPYDTNFVAGATRLLLVTPGISFKQLKAEQVRYRFGETDASFYVLTIATPVDPLPPTGTTALLNFSRGAKVIVGVIQRIDRGLSSLVKVYVKETPEQPITLAEVLALVTPVSP